jgi:hypothetical protein
MYVDGIVFYQSTNKVILTSGKEGILESKYFLKVLQKSKDGLSPIDLF